MNAYCSAFDVKFLKESKSLGKKNGQLNELVVA